MREGEVVEWGGVYVVSCGKWKKNIKEYFRIFTMKKCLCGVDGKYMGVYLPTPLLEILGKMYLRLLLHLGFNPIAFQKKKDCYCILQMGFSIHTHKFLNTHIFKFFFKIPKLPSS